MYLHVLLYNNNVLVTIEYITGNLLVQLGCTPDQVPLA